MLVFVAFVQGFIGTLVWLLLSEIFPMAIRGFAMGIAVFVLWCVNALISFGFPILAEAAGVTVTFGGRGQPVADDRVKDPAAQPPADEGSPAGRRSPEVSRA